MIVFQEAAAIEALETEVVELYRCTSPVSLVIEGMPGPDAQAVACAIRRDGCFFVYAALHVRNLKRSLVYAVDPQPGGRLEYVEALQKARDFAQAIGFQMEKVGLRFSPAMREVILRQIPVILPPQEAEKILLDRTAERAELERLIAESDREEPTDEDPQATLTPDQLSQRRQARESRAAAARNAAGKLAMEKRLDEQTEALRRLVEHHLEQINAPEAAAAETTEKEQLEAELTASRGSVNELQSSLRALESRLRKGEAERAQLMREKAAADQRLTELQQKLQQAELQALVAQESAAAADQSRQEMTGQLQQAVQEAEKTIGALEKKLRQTEKQAETTARQQKEQAEVDDRQTTELQQKLEQLQEELEAVRDEGRRLQEAKAAAEARAAELAKQSEALTQARAELESERKTRRQLEKAGRQYESRLTELEQALRQSPPATAKGEGPAEAPAGAAGEIAALREALRQSEERVEFLRHEVERFAAAKTVAEQRLADAQASGPPAAAAAPPSPPQGKRQGLGSLMLAKTDPGPPPHVVRRPPPPGAFFHVDWDCSAVPCPTLGDLCEVHQSIGMVQLSLEGYPNQYCTAFIVVVKNGDQKRLFMPFHLCSSNRVLVYVPAEQPASPAALAKAMKEASRFLLVVGMETERITLSRKGKLPADLEAILALGDPPRSAGNF